MLFSRLSTILHLGACGIDKTMFAHSPSAMEAPLAVADRTSIDWMPNVPASFAAYRPDCAGNHGLPVDKIRL
jgi:hypothetical protein